MKHSFLLAGTALLTLAFVTPAIAETPFTLSNTTSSIIAKVDVDTKAFVKQASIGGMFEVESSKLALEKSQNKDVKEFAQMMIDDHTKTNDKLMGILSEKDEKSYAAKKLDSKHQAKLDALKKSAQFDKYYLKAQKEAHATTISLFNAYAMRGSDAEIKQFATDTLPALKKHQKHLADVTL